MAKDYSYPLPECIMNFGDFNATDPRDMIFALLALVTDAKDDAVSPDYQTSVEKHYERVTRYLLTRDNEILVLARAGVGFPRSLTKLPSWVPDWTSTPKVRTFY